MHEEHRGEGLKLVMLHQGESDVVHLWTKQGIQLGHVGGQPAREIW